MANTNIIGVAPQHVQRIDPDITVDELGNVIWTPCLLDYNANVFYRGKTVTNDEFNTLFLRQLYQGNYTTDSLVELLKEHLGTAIHRKFTNTYKLVNSYVQTFTSDAWGEAHEDGYYYITIPASVHGFEPLGGPELERMNIDVELYLLNNDGRFYEIDQMYVDPDNTVTLYTDDANVIGFVVIRTNERSYSLAAGDIHAEQVRGLAKVGITGLYNDLHGLPDLTGITTNAEDIAKIIAGDTTVENANYAKDVTDSVGHRPIANIFEEGSSVVKRATRAESAYTADYATIYDKSQHFGDKLARHDIVTFQVSIHDTQFQVTAIADSNGIYQQHYTVVDNGGLALVRYGIVMNNGYSGVDMVAAYATGSHAGELVQSTAISIVNWISFTKNKKD